MSSIDLFDVIRSHSIEFYKKVHPKELIVYLPGLTAFNVEDITTHRTRTDQINTLIDAINAKVRINELLRALMEVKLEDLAETLENEYNRRRPNVKACRFREENDNDQNRIPPAPILKSIPCSPTQVEPQTKQPAQAISRTANLDESPSQCVVNHVTNINVTGVANVQWGDENRLSSDGAAEKTTTCSEINSLGDNGSSDESISIVCEEERSTFNANGNNNERAPFTNRSQSEQVEDRSTSPKHISFEREEQSSINSSCETFVKKSPNASFTTITGENNTVQNNLRETVQLLGVAIREKNNPIESCPSEEDETFVKQRCISDNLQTLSKQQTGAQTGTNSAECKVGVAVKVNAGCNTTALPNAINSKESLASNAPLAGSSTASVTALAGSSKTSATPIIGSSKTSVTPMSDYTPATVNLSSASSNASVQPLAGSPIAAVIPLAGSSKTSVTSSSDSLTAASIGRAPDETSSIEPVTSYACNIPNRDNNIPLITARAATSDTIVQNSRVAPASTPVHNESNNHDDSSLMNSFDFNLKSTEDLLAEMRETKKSANELKIKKTVGVMTFKQLPSNNCSDSFVMSDLTGTDVEDVRNKLSEATRATGDIRICEACIGPDNVQNNSQSESNGYAVSTAKMDNTQNGLTTDQVDESKYETKIKILDRMTMNQLGSKSTGSFEMSSNIDSDNVRDSVTCASGSTTNSLNSTSYESFGTSDTGENDDIRIDGEMRDDEVAVNSAEIVTQNVSTSNSVTPVLATRTGLISSAVKFLLTASLAAQKCTSSSFTQ